MIDTDKVYVMTKAALYEQKEQNGALKTVLFRRKDYILFHMLLVLLAVTVAYALLVGTVLFMIVMAYDSLVLNVSEMVLILIAVIIGYVVLVILYYVISHQFYGSRHVRAKESVKEYLSYLKTLKEMNRDGAATGNGAAAPHRKP